MADKREAMNNFQNAINQSKKREADKKRQEEMQQEEYDEREKQKKKSTNETERVHKRKKKQPEKRQPTEEEKQQEEMQTKREYNIDDDEIEDDEDGENSPNSRYRSNTRGNGNGDDDEDNDDEDDHDEGDDNNLNNNNKDDSRNSNEKEDSNSTGNENDQSIDIDSDDVQSDSDNANTIDDDKQSASDTKESQEGKDSGNKENDSNTDSGERQGAKDSADTSTGQSGSQGTGGTVPEGLGSGAEGAGTSTGGAAAGTEAGASGAGAGAAAGEEAAATAGATVAGAPLWVVILIIVLVIMILIIVIGYASFFYNGPGIIRDKILEYANGIWVDLKGFFGNNPDEAKVTDEQIGNIAMYLESMRYDLPNYGFLDNDKGMPFDTSEMNEDGTGVIKDSDGHVVYKKVKDETTGEIKVEEIKSKYIKAYLAAENNTYMVANQNGSIKDIFQSSYNDDWGTGMIHLENLGDDNKIKNYVKVDRENKKMIITYHNYVYQYDLDGWTGRYGKSIEFLITMHLATMAPDFVYDIVKDEDFDTKVNIALYPTQAKINMQTLNEDGELVTIDQNNYSQFGLTYDQWEAIQEYTAGDPETGLIDTFTPFITSVKRHWYKDLDFTDCYATSENDPNTTDDDEGFTSVYEYVGLGENDVLSNLNIDLYVQEIRQKDIFQIKEPMVKKNGKIKEMLLGKEDGTGDDEEAEVNINEEYKYYIYNGSTIPDEGLEKNYIIHKVNLPETEDGPEYTMNTRTFTYAFAILEDVHSEDAEYVLRDLKELFEDLGVYTEDERGSEESTTPEPLVWPVKDYKPIVWDPIYNAQTTKVVIKHKTSTTLGFEPDMKVVMPANGEIVSISKEENTNVTEQESTSSLGDIVKIRLTGSDREELEDMYIYISGIEINEGVSIGQRLNAETPIGKTIERDISIIMTDSKRKAIQNVDEYFIPEAWDVLVETDEIEDSQFEGDVLQEDNGGEVEYVGTLSEQFYWYLATLEGMPITTDSYFTNQNGGVNWLNGESYITVGPGIYMHEDNCRKFRNNGYSNFNQYSLQSIFPKDVTTKVYMQNMEEIKQVIENYMQGYNLTQSQMEALILSAYQRGTGSGSTLWRVLDAIKSGKRGNELASIWTRSGNSYASVRQRRWAEWYLFTYGKYVNKDTGREVQFSSDTPFTDMLNGIQSGHMY